MKTPKQISFLEEDKTKQKTSWFSNALEHLKISEKPSWPDAFGDSLMQWNNENKAEPIRILSLFSGAGGLDIGFHDAGFKIVECNEIEEAFAATIIENSKSGQRLEGSSVVCSDIKQYTPSLKNIDFIIGGPPCQTFSAAGTRAAGVNGTDDDRGNLFWEYVRILELLKPQGFLFENVYRIVGAQGGKPWRQIQQAFQDVGYKLYWRILDAADYGVPQFRERLIIVGLREGDFRFPFPSHGPDSSDQRNYYTASSATNDIIVKETNENLNGRHGHLLNGIPPGLNYSFYTERMGHPKPIFGWRSKFSDYLYKADPETPVRTIKAQGGQYTGPFHWENRRFTVSELKRLQTFPDNYTILGSYQKIAHQIGNSVPPQLARVLALSILQQVFNRDLPFQLQLMPNSYKLGFRARKRNLSKIYAKKAADAIALLPKTAAPTSPANKGVFSGKLTDDLRLISVQEEKHKSSFFRFDHSIESGEWVINLKEKDTEQVKYELSIFPRRMQSKDSYIKSITLRSFSEKEESVLALWKYLEKIITDIELKDDLVQLFGYYQYKQAYKVSIKIFGSHIMEAPFWKVLSKISEGYGVGKITRISELEQTFLMPEEDIIKSLKRLKKLGFEIRSTNTNQQIPNGMLLIPYAFPTLNERSLQRFTEL